MSEGGEAGTAALQHAIADACLDRDAGRGIRELRGFLEQHGAAAVDVEAALTAPRRLSVYRSLVRNGLSAVVVRMLPRTRARLNAACAGRFDADFARWVEEVGPRTPYLRDVPAELIGWADGRWRSDPDLPAYLPDLAALELAQFSVAASEANAGGQATDVALDRPVAFSGSTRVLRASWAVHELPEDESGREEPERRAVQLLAYRDADHTVHWLELTPLACLIVERLQARESLGEALVAACASTGTAPAAVLPEIARLLADLGARGVILGGHFG